MAAEPIALTGDYSAVLLDEAEFVPLFRQYRPRVFANTLELLPGQLMSEVEKKAVQDLSRRMGTPYRLNLGIYHAGQFIGWSFGAQADGDTFSMITCRLVAQRRIWPQPWASCLPMVTRRIRPAVPMNSCFSAQTGHWLTTRLPEDAIALSKSILSELSLERRCGSLRRRLLCSFSRPRRYSCFRTRLGSSAMRRLAFVPTAYGKERP